MCFFFYGSAHPIFILNIGPISDQYRWSALYENIWSPSSVRDQHGVQETFVEAKLFLVLFADAHSANPDADTEFPCPHPGADPQPGHAAHPDAGTSDCDDHLRRQPFDPEPGHLPPEPDTRLPR